ncbi:hypothetical protein ILYODFUR_004859 [Ilyodon furcidens]|uniref:Uncharacterized protein n=1 Tax=Ilyodon furcidens TaxID=33524 RepID=A0ABV0TG94_9TELE
MKNIMHSRYIPNNSVFTHIIYSYRIPCKKLFRLKELPRLKLYNVEKNYTHSLPIIQVTGAAVSTETPRLPSPKTPPAHLVEARGIPRPAERHSPSSILEGCPGPFPGPPPGGTRPEGI